MIYYISDLHFYHSNIIKMCQRPAANVKMMNESLINYWNRTVTNDDTVYFLGDFSFKCSQNQADKILEQLNGKKYFIKGNHDKETWLNRIKEKHLIEDWFDYKDINDNGRRVILCHYPLHSWNGMHRGSYHLYGHVHKKTVANAEWQKNRFNVSCEVLYYTPKTLDQLIEERDRKEEEYKEALENYRVKLQNVIIKVTLKEDRDSYIEDLRAVCHNELPKFLQGIEKHEKSELYQKYFNLINPNITKKLTKDDNEFIISTFSKILEEAISFYKYSREDAYVLNASLKVGIVDNDKDKLTNVIDTINIKLNSVKNFRVMIVLEDFRIFGF